MGKKGYVFNILEECVIMAAGLSSKNIFTSPYQRKLLAYHVKMSWAEGSFSDPITLLNAYQVYKNMQHNEHFKRSGQTEAAREKHWAQQNFIQLKALKVQSISIRNYSNLAPFSLIVQIKFEFGAFFSILQFEFEFGA